MDQRKSEAWSFSSKPPLPGLIEKACQFDAPRYVFTRPCASIDHRIIRQTRHLSSVASESSKRKPTVNHHVFAGIQRIRIDHDRHMASGIEEVRPHHQLIRTPFQRQIGKDFFQDGIGFRCPKQNPVGILKSIILEIEIEHLEGLALNCARHCSVSRPISLRAHRSA